jgi:hypothetical protein
LQENQLASARRRDRRPPILANLITMGLLPQPNVQNNPSNYASARARGFYLKGRGFSSLKGRGFYLKGRGFSSLKGRGF